MISRCEKKRVWATDLWLDALAWKPESPGFFNRNRTGNFVELLKPMRVRWPEIISACWDVEGKGSRLRSMCWELVGSLPHVVPRVLIGAVCQKESFFKIEMFDECFGVFFADHFQLRLII